MNLIEPSGIEDVDKQYLEVCTPLRRVLWPSASKIEYCFNQYKS